MYTYHFSVHTMMGMLLFFRRVVICMGKFQSTFVRKNVSQFVFLSQNQPVTVVIDFKLKYF